MPPLLPTLSPSLFFYAVGLLSYIKDHKKVQLRFCSQCGNALAKRARFCDKCGTPIRKLRLPVSSTVIVPARNAEQTIGKTLSSIINQSAQPDQIVVIDDASNDRTAEIAQGFPDIRFIHNRERLGKALSINQVLDDIDTDFICVCDADTELEWDYLELVGQQFADPDVGAACGFVLSSLRSKSKAVLRVRTVDYVFAQSTIKRGQNLLGGLYVMSGCCTMYRTDSLKRMGGIPLDTVTEDLDLTWRLQEAGYRLSFVDNTYAYTLEPPTLSQYYRQVSRWFLGFFENISRHGRRIFRRPPFAASVLANLIEGMLFTVIWESLLAMWIFSLLLLPFGIELWQYAAFWTIIVFGWDFGVLMFPTSVRARRIGRLKDFAKGIPLFFAFRFLNGVIWWNSLVNFLFRTGRDW